MRNKKKVAIFSFVGDVLVGIVLAFGGSADLVLGEDDEDRRNFQSLLFSNSFAAEIFAVYVSVTTFVIIPILCAWFAAVRLIVITKKLCCCFGCKNTSKRCYVIRSILWLCIGFAGLIGFIVFSIAAEQYNFMVQIVAVWIIIGVPPVVWLYYQKEYELHEEK